MLLNSIRQATEQTTMGRAERVPPAQGGHQAPPRGRRWNNFSLKVFNNFHEHE